MNMTVGQILLDEALPADMRGPRVLDKKGLQTLMNELADKHPEDFRKVNHALWKLGEEASHTKGLSFSIKDLRAPVAFKAKADLLKQAVIALAEDESLDAPTKERKIRDLVANATPDMEELLYTAALKENNPFALQVLSGSRGNKSQLRSLLGGDFLVQDHRDRVIPMPILTSYAQGVSPAEYWAGSYGARKGTISTKFCLAEGTQVLMSDYSVKGIERIVPGDMVMTVDRNCQLTPTRVTQHFKNGLRPCSRFTFREGRSKGTVVLVGTRRHNARLCYRSREGNHELQDRMLPLDNASKGRKSLVVPLGAAPGLGVEEPRAGLLGLLLGDGGLTTQQTNFYTVDAALVAAVQVMSEPHNLKPVLAQAATENGAARYSLQEIKASVGVGGGCKTPFRQWLKELGILGEASPYKQIPYAVWSWDRKSCEKLAAWLLETDGCATITTNQQGLVYPVVSFVVTSEDLAVGFRRLLETKLGVYAAPLNSRDVVGLSTIQEREVHRNHNLHGFVVSTRANVKRLAEFWKGTGSKSAAFQAAMAQCRSQYAEDLPRRFMSAAAVGLLETHDLEVEHPSHCFVLGNMTIVSNSTQDAGFFGKQLMQAAHRMVVTEDDCGTDRGILVDGDDSDNIGALLAKPVGDFEADSPMTPKMAKSLGKQSITLRSPVTCQARHGVCKKCAGIRETGALPEIGDNVGVIASTSLTERLSQAQLNVKHTGGLHKGGKKDTDDDGADDEEDAKPELTGFKLINQLTQVPTAFRGGAAIAQTDGSVDSVIEEPQGGHSIVIHGQKHYVPSDLKVLVKPGQMMEAGDILSEGIPNPAELVKHKGVGAGRRAFVDIFRNAFKSSGMNVNRRNIELVARGLINHVRVTDLDGPDGALPDDVVEYDTLERDYQPRHGFMEMQPRKAVGMYLERPELHYSIGTRITKSVADSMDKGGIKAVYAHQDEPSFTAEMIPVMRQLSKTPNWQTRLGGSFLQTGMTEAVHRSRKSEMNDTSFIPALARGADFGRQLTTKGVY